MVRGRYRVGVSKTKTKEKIMMKKKVMPLSCLMAAAMLAGCGTAAPAVPEETTAPAVETAEAAQETAPAGRPYKNSRNCPDSSCCFIFSAAPAYPQEQAPTALCAGRSLPNSRFYSWRAVSVSA